MGEWDFGFLAAIAVRTTIVFVVLVVGLRATGRRQVAELNLHDLLLVLIVANAVQNAMTRGDGRLTVALVSSGALLLLGTLFAALRSRLPSAERWVVGVPTVVAEDGRPNRKNMRRGGITDEELRAAVREHGLADLSAVKIALLETDGSISVIPREQKPES